MVVIMQQYGASLVYHNGTCLKTGGWSIKIILLLDKMEKKGQNYFSLFNWLNSGAVTLGVFGNIYCRDIVLPV